MTTTSTDVIIHVFGTQTLVTSTAAVSIGSSAFSATASIVTWTNTNDVPEAAFVLTCTYSSAPSVANPTINLYARPMSIGAASTAMSQPTTAFKSIYLTSFLASSSSAVQILTASAPLPNVETAQAYEFFIENQGSTLISSDWTLYITPRSQRFST